jgi:hypothetical protein
MLNSVVFGCRLETFSIRTTLTPWRNVLPAASARGMTRGEGIRDEMTTGKTPRSLRGERTGGSGRPSGMCQCNRESLPGLISQDCSDGFGSSPPPAGCREIARPCSSTASRRGRPLGLMNRPGSANAWISTVTVALRRETWSLPADASKFASRCRCVAKRWIRRGPEYAVRAGGSPATSRIVDARGLLPTASGRGPGS